MIKKTFLLLVSTILLFPIYVSAYSEYIIASGQNIGIELNSNGVLVVGFYKVNDDYIAKDTGLSIGDIITTINDQEITNIYDLSKNIENSNGDIKIGYIRNDILKYTDLKLIKENNTYKTGIYVKDSISGIGTLTYIDPETKLFGALGHEILDKNTGSIFTTDAGNIYSSLVTGIVPSINGTPGEKNARVDSNSIYGTVFENTNQGIYGNYTADLDISESLYKVGQPHEINKGEAVIKTVINDNEIEEYTINIDSISDGNIKNISFTITDERLLDKTGGIIQGMSGSPIIQNDMIIGAVTHVVVDNPERGYGIFITNMLEQAEN